jgi:hypothetical protein
MKWQPDINFNLRNYMRIEINNDIGIVNIVRNVYKNQRFLYKVNQ